MADPLALALAAITSPNTTVLRRVDIYMADGVTPWLTNVGFTDGSISVDGSRAERRSIDMTLANSDGVLNPHPGAFWYDKIIKTFRGVQFADGTPWLQQVGEFRLDTIKGSNFPKTELSITGRDYAGQLQADLFPITTTFVQGLSLEAVIRAIATNGGITKFALPTTGHTLGKDYVFDAGTDRWKAMNDLALAFGYDLYFDGAGYLVLREFRDPLTSPTSFSFASGPGGTLSTFHKSTTGARLYNHVVVAGDSSDSSIPAVWAQVENNNPNSFTSIAQIGRRTYRYTSSFITTTAQALDVATKFLGIHSMEDFEADFDALIIPWLEANDIVEVLDPAPALGDPTRYLLSSFTIPMKLGAGPVVAKRVTLVG